MKHSAEDMQDTAYTPVFSSTVRTVVYVAGLVASAVGLGFMTFGNAAVGGYISTVAGLITAGFGVLHAFKGGSCVGYPPFSLSLCYSTCSRMLTIWQERCRSTPLVSSSIRHSHVVPSAFTVWIRGVQHCAGDCGGGAIAQMAHMPTMTAMTGAISHAIGGSVFIVATPSRLRL